MLEVNSGLKWKQGGGWAGFREAWGSSSAPLITGPFKENTNPGLN